MIEIELFPTKTDIFYKNAAAKTRYIFNQGGTGSSKTISLCQLIYLIANKRSGITISVVSETMPHMKKGAMKDFKDILLRCGHWDENSFNKTDFIYKINNSIIEFFSADSADKVHGPRRDYLYVNEIQNITYETFFHLASRTRKRIYADYNPTSEFWVHEKYLDDINYSDQLTYIHSTYKDNPYLEPEIVKDILTRAKRDENYKRVYIDGLPGILEGLIYPNVTIIDSFPENTEPFMGMDFGYTNAPTSLIMVAKINDCLYFDEIIYQNGLQNRDIARPIIEMGLNEMIIWADSEDPKSIDEISGYGVNIHGADKPKGSVNFGIQLVKQYKLHVTKRSVNLIKEFRNYRWKEDKDGKTVNEPLKMFDHGMDAMRYAVFMELNDMTEWKAW